MLKKLRKNAKKIPWLYRFFVNCANIPETTLYYIIKTFFKIEDKAVFKSFAGKSYSCNPRALSEELHRKSPETKIVWLFRNPDAKKTLVPEYVQCVNANSIRALYEMTTARFWIDNYGKPMSSKKRKGQVYIQTWHGDRGFKKVLYDVRTRLPNGHYKEGDLFEEKSCDIMTAGSLFGEKKLRSAFGYKGELLKFGSPRNDLLLKADTEVKNRIKKNLGLPPQVKTVLFAPTFRKSNDGGKQDMQGINLREITEFLKKQTGCEWACMLRAHSVSGGLAYDEKDAEAVIDVTKYEDMAELLLITDLFITDYSSSAGDYILTKKPLILFQPDIEEYAFKNRTFYFNIDASPFITAKSQTALMDIISELDEEKAKKNCEDIMEFYGVYESGEAARKTVEHMLSML